MEMSRLVGAIVFFLSWDEANVETERKSMFISLISTMSEVGVFALNTDRE